MDVLIVASESPPIVSGISRCVGYLSEGLRAREHRVDVISSVTMPRLCLEEYRFSSLAFYWPRVARSLSRYDVVNLHGPVPTLSDAYLMLSTTLGRGRRPPLVYTHHCAIEIAGHRRACRTYNAWHSRLLKIADGVVASSEAYAQQLQSPLGRSVSVIPWGVSPVSTTLEPRIPGPLRLLFVGQMRSYKGVERLLEAVSGDPAMELTLVGSGPHLASYQAFARQLRSPNVKFLGRLPDDLLREQYARADVVVLPSVTRAEAFGLVVLEGMSAGCVPVASDLPGVRELVGDAGMVVRRHDPYELHRALRQLVADPAKLATLRTRAHQRALSLSWDRCVSRYVDAFVDAGALQGRHNGGSTTTIGSRGDATSLPDGYEFAGRR